MSYLWQHEQNLPPSRHKEHFTETPDISLNLFANEIGEPALSLGVGETACAGFSLLPSRISGSPDGQRQVLLKNLYYKRSRVIASGLFQGSVN